MGIMLAVVLIVMVVMNGAMFYVLRTAAIVTRKQVDRLFVRKLEQYDSFLDQKENRGAEIEEKREALEAKIRELEGVANAMQSSPFYSPKPVKREAFVPIAHYIHSDFFREHRKVLDQIGQIDFQELVQEVSAGLRKTMEQKGLDSEKFHTCGRLLENLSLDTVYQLELLENEQQAAILTDVLSELGTAEQELLEEYLEENPAERFDTLEFTDWLRQIQRANDPTIYVRCGEKEASYQADGMNVVTQYDESIAGGVMILWQDLVMDYSI